MGFIFSIRININLLIETFIKVNKCVYQGSKNLNKYCAGIRNDFFIIDEITDIKFSH